MFAYMVKTSVNILYEVFVEQREDISYTSVEKWMYLEVNEICNAVIVIYLHAKQISTV